MCDLCMQTYCPKGCPNYLPPKSIVSCDICGEGIYDGEEYIENLDGYKIHFDCIQGIRQLLNWLGYDVKEFYSP